MRREREREVPFTGAANDLGENKGQTKTGLSLSSDKALCCAVVSETVRKQSPLSSSQIVIRASPLVATSLCSVTRREENVGHRH